MIIKLLRIDDKILILVSYTWYVFQYYEKYNITLKKYWHLYWKFSFKSRFTVFYYWYNRRHRNTFIGGRNMFNISSSFSKLYLAFSLPKGNKLLPINTQSSSLHCALHSAIFHRSNLVERRGSWWFEPTIIIYHSIDEDIIFIISSTT